MNTSEQFSDVFSALVKARAELTNPTLDAEVTLTKGGLKAKYASLPNIIDTITPVLTKHELMASQELITRQDGTVGVMTTIIHSSGQFIEFGPFSLPVQNADPKTYGAAATYARRYHLPAVLGLVGQEDDGGAGLPGALDAAIAALLAATTMDDLKKAFKTHYVAFSKMPEEQAELLRVKNERKTELENGTGNA